MDNPVVLDFVKNNFTGKRPLTVHGGYVHE